MLVDVPLEVLTPRLVVRCYRAGDGPILHAVAIRNRTHLAKFEAGNILLTADSEERGEVLARELHARWVSRDAFFAGAFLRATGDFVGQVYLGLSTGTSRRSRSGTWPTASTRAEDS